jgi:hypothetical protein
MLIVYSDSVNNPHQYPTIVYQFPPNVLPKVQKHGNAIEDSPFYPTLPSTQKLIKAGCQQFGPKQAFHYISASVGGILSLSTPGELPRNERQIKYASKVSKSRDYNPADELYSVMFRAKQEDSSDPSYEISKFCQTQLS